MKRGKMLGGKPPRRGGRLTGSHREPSPRPEGANQLLAVVAAGALILGGVAGFTVAQDRQLRGGLLAQRQEAMRRPDWVAMSDLPPYLPAAFLVAVDPGFEAARRVRSAEEGNTIPRELVRQIHLLGNGLGGEARELVMAPVLEQRASRDQILELYLNRVYLGVARDVPTYGVFHASREYFGKSPTELTLGEAATLAGLLLEPRIERPDEMAGAIGARRNDILRSLAETGQITPESYAQAVRERLAFQPGISEPPMTRHLPSPSDTAVIRLPPEYRPQPDPAAQDSLRRQGARGAPG